MNAADHSRLLRRALQANAAFSTLSALVFTIGNSVVAGFLGAVSPPQVLALGIGLGAFAALLWWLQARPRLSRPLIMGIIAGDIAWVLGTAVVVMLGLFSARGTMAAVLIALIVAAFALAQWLGSRRLDGA